MEQSNTAALICKCSDLFYVADKLRTWDETLFRHSLQVADLVREVAIMHGYTPKQTARLQIAGFLHDLGKINWPRYMITKRPPLNASDIEIVHDHPRYSELYAKEYVPAVDDLVLRMVREHHEKPDGRGYPRGIEPDELSKVLSATESFVAMVEYRRYRPCPLSVADALKVADKDGFDLNTLETIKYLYQKGAVAVAVNAG